MFNVCLLKQCVVVVNFNCNWLGKYLVFILTFSSFNFIIGSIFSIYNSIDILGRRSISSGKGSSVQ